MGGINVSGLFIRGGKINPDTFFLEEEKTREFETDFPICKLCIEKKIKNRDEILQNKVIYSSL